LEGADGADGGGGDGEGGGVVGLEEAEGVEVALWVSDGVIE